MSGSAKNVQRDGTYVKHNQALTGWGAQFVHGNATGTVSGLATVFEDFAQVQADYTADITLTNSNCRAVGVYMQNPVKDRQPYRVKASFYGQRLQSYNNQAAIMVGYAEASHDGIDDVVDVPRFFHFESEYDDLIIVEPSIALYEDRALVIALVAMPSSNVSADKMYGHLSVQSLGVSPPTMQYAVP